MDLINEAVLGHLPHLAFDLISRDKVNIDNSQAVPEEILNSMNIAGFPAHHIKLKVNMVVMLLRNLNISNGLCNGTRLVVDGMKPCVLYCTVLNGSHSGI